MLHSNSVFKLSTSNENLYAHVDVYTIFLSNTALQADRLYFWIDISESFLVSVHSWIDRYFWIFPMFVYVHKFSLSVSRFSVYWDMSLSYIHVTILWCVYVVLRTRTTRVKMRARPTLLCCSNVKYISILKVSIRWSFWSLHLCLSNCLCPTVS